ncbi:hypothetical protein [Prochlorococcus marinus]|uniref:Uncharacterized protein n=1 Tax=Prochlorococcus marinus (strain MIT 9303) TaxID=59922 RepID=A2CBC5_PROM3|nr:hypothetical protein [Prochlorococcus marinus]ABM78785.1 Hypothetical protein P9303_20471 [Prochlorococcus marinus str. MIT 9303]
MTEPPQRQVPTEKMKKLRDLEFELRINKLLTWFILLLVLFFFGYKWEVLGITPIAFFLLGCSYSWSVERGKEKHKEVLRLRLMINPSVEKQDKLWD